VLADVVELLRCPVCAGELELGEGALRCAAGHSFDIARQGYVNLVPGRADTPEMVEARDAFLRAGHYRRLSEALAKEASAEQPAAEQARAEQPAAEQARAEQPAAEQARAATAAGGADAARDPGSGDGGRGAGGVVLDLGAGTGHHLAAVLDAVPDRQGIAIDASAAALRRAARAHRRAAAVGADAWKPLPLRDGIATTVLSVFAPRNAAEMARVLAPDGALLAVTPTTRHLYELVGPLGLLSVPDDKENRLDAQLASHFALAGRRRIEHAMFLTRDECAQLVRMGPSAWHVDERSVEDRLSALPDPLTVTASMTVSVFAGRHAAPRNGGSRHASGG
jgi:23S rRNA (guanine745-N1)-methyltransferase